MSVSTVMRVTRPMRVRMALGLNNSVQRLGERRHLYMVVVSPIANIPKRLTPKPAELTRLVRVHLRRVQPVRMVSIAGNNNENGY